ncbi:velvet factor [Fomitopsis serialis]|uniref:velvet factor n=1 Tax=Fomitopsis serialis TaxID=139415 RepID=UPI00200768E5|nr:velvet factor [Neoantrodia serialis]KAH9931918.1 velvet factor [Neoantrodia serialis]
MGRPAVSFLSGPLAGRTIRVQLDELQKADLGRKCAVKDRRPLDPPPVVRLRLFELDNVGTMQETEHELTNLSEPMALGFVCFVDLFPFPGGNDAEPSSDQIVAYIEGAPITHGTCCTTAFVGTTFVSVSSFNIRGESILLGVFPDLAVNVTGKFLTRYRVVSTLHATFEHSRRAVLAECWGGPVVIYPANMFPGLQESTDLTKVLETVSVCLEPLIDLP